MPKLKVRYKGQDFSKEEILTVPNQSLSLQEIIDRFIRNESVPVGFPTEFHESEDDIEKLRKMDPVDRAEYIKKMKDVQARYNEQEEKKRLALEDKTRKEFIAKIEAETRQKLESEQKAK